MPLANLLTNMLVLLQLEAPSLLEHLPCTKQAV